jgi:hypothetical protein
VTREPETLKSMMRETGPWCGFIDATSNAGGAGGDCAGSRYEFMAAIAAAAAIQNVFCIRSRVISACRTGAS